MKWQGYQKDLPEKGSNQKRRLAGKNNNVTLPAWKTFRHRLGLVDCQTQYQSQPEKGTQIMINIPMEKVF